MPRPEPAPSVGAGGAGGAGAVVRVAVASALLGALATAGCGDGSAEPRLTVSDSAGVRIVENRGEDLPAPWAPRRLGELVPPDSGLTAVPWGVAADPATGRIYVADQTGGRVAVFDAEGGHRRDLGRGGDGPGEFRSPVALSIDRYGALTVWDVGRGVLSRWSSEGDLLNERRGPADYWGPGLRERPGRIVTVTSEVSGLRLEQRLVAIAPGDTTTLHALPAERRRAELPCGSFVLPPVFSPMLVWTAQGDTVHVLRGRGYRIDLFAGGRWLRSVRRDLATLDVDAGMAARRARIAEYGSLLRRCGVTAEELVTAVGHEEVVSPVQWITPDPEGRLWIARTTDGVTPGQVDVFGPDGRYLGSLEGVGIPVAFVSATRFAAISVDPETDEPELSLYALDERPASPAGEDASGVRYEDELEIDPAVRGFRDCPECPPMVELPPGRFRMGAPDGEAPAEGDPTRPERAEAAERPQVEVEIDYRLAIGKYEVTFAEWDRCVEAGGCDYVPDDEGWGRDGRPVIHVSRDDALAYVDWLSGETGRTYRLPSEAEWEYAVRAGTTTARWWGDELRPEMAACDGCGTRWDDHSTAPVGSFPPNPFGLHDLLSNVSEWVADCWIPTHQGNPGDGSARTEESPGWRDGRCTRPVSRGGSFRYHPWTVRAAWRWYSWPGPWHPRDSDSRGFRVARTVGGSGR